jgi:hypothetical protein
MSREGEREEAAAGERVAGGGASRETVREEDADIGRDGEREGRFFFFC